MRAAGPMRPVRTGPVCPVCGTTLPDRAGRSGRPAAWCGTACRQSAYRARRAAAAAEKTAEKIAGQIAGTAYGAVQDAGRVLACEVLDLCERPDGGRELQDGPRWEPGLARAARELARAAAALERLADQHAQAATDYRRARAVFRHPEARRGGDDETPDGIVTAAAAAGDATKPAIEAATEPAEVNAVVDVDELFDAIEDVLQDVQDVPTDVLDPAFAGALERLAQRHQDASGDGPLDKLLAAAITVAMASQGAALPDRAAAAVTRLTAAALPQGEVTAGTS